MLLVRDVFQAKYGRGDELVALFGEIAEHWRHGQHSIELRGNRTLTDASGPSSRSSPKSKWPDSRRGSSSSPRSSRCRSSAIGSPA
ncbi:hypothetical protein [Candidatus Amarolinea dominans]|uniref:hypothetical protein n=1 Tax=Candidatus Amarolinea dominans TaxID=3140696 RepID=UPI001D2A747E|nr:hypothetical protein [Anaerolineae bacterium]